MKIGIITYHNADNYGAVLQATALAEVIKHTVNNCDVEIINFTPVVIRKKNLKVFLANLIKIIRKSNKTSLFWSFLAENNKISVKYSKTYDLKKLNDKYDAFVVGSDQVWNPDAIDSQYAFYLGFASPEKRTVSYAASFGVPQIDDVKKQQIVSQLINKINFVSVRELDGVKLVNHLCSGKEVFWAPDPTLLKKENYWSQFADKGTCLFDVEQERYIFAYFNRTHHLNDYIKEIQKETGMKVIVVHRTQINEKEEYIKDYNCDPYAFLKYIKNAEYVFTDSFHGLCFSIIFQKRFVTCAVRNPGKENSQGRIVNLCKRLHLEDRILYDDMLTIPNLDGIAYTKVNDELEIWREDANRFLKNALK